MSLLLERSNPIQIEEPDYDIVLRGFENRDSARRLALIGMANADRQFDVQTWPCQYEVSHWYQLHRHYLKDPDDTEELYQGICEFFPELIFSRNVRAGLDGISHIRDNAPEIVRHLTALDTYGMLVFDEYGRTAGEVDVLRRLGSMGGIECSTQGDPVYEKRNLTFSFLNDHELIENVVCSPHTKLFHSGSDLRIYFTWGKNSIGIGKNLLIGHIGRHL